MTNGNIIKLYSFVRFDKSKGELVLIDFNKNKFIKLNKKDFSIGSNLGNFLNVFEGKWIDFDPFNNEIDFYLKETDSCKFSKILGKINNNNNNNNLNFKLLI